MPDVSEARSTRGALCCRAALLAAALSVLFPLPAHTAEWRLFGVEGYSGYLALQSEGYDEQTGKRITTRQSLEQLAKLRLSSYVFHPRFLALSAEAALALRSGASAEAGPRNVDYGLAVDLLRENMLTAGMEVQSRVENLERNFQDCQRWTKGTTMRLALQGARLSATARYEDSQVTSERVFREDKLNRVLLLDSSFRPTSSDTVTLRHRAVHTDDRLPEGQDSQYQTTDLASAHSIGRERGAVNLFLTSWQAVEPGDERRLTFREHWLMNWSPLLRSIQELEATRRDQGGVAYLTYRTALDASRSLGEAWQIGGNLSATKNLSSAGEENAIYRVGNSLGYRSRWSGYDVSVSNRLGLTQNLTGPDRTMAVFGEPYRLHTDGSNPQVLLHAYVRHDSIVVKNQDDGTDWSDYCDTWQDGVYTYLRWKLGTPPPPGHEGTTLLEVTVDYVYELPAINYVELSDYLSLRATREFAPGLGVESSALVSSLVPVAAASPPSGRLSVDSRYEAAVQGFVRRPAYEVAAGGSAGTGRQTLFARGSVSRYGWTFSELCQVEFFPDFTGQRFETKANRLWGINEKTHVNLEFSDQSYSAAGRFSLGLTSARVRATWHFTPFMRLELEGRVESNRAATDDRKAAFGTKYVWQQGQLDLTAGYEFKVRTYDRFSSQRLYVTLIRRL